MVLTSLSRLYTASDAVFGNTPEVQKRQSPVSHRWCQVGTRTHVTITFYSRIIPPSLVRELLDDAFDYIVAYLERHPEGEGRIQGEFRQLGRGATTLKAYSINDRLTYGALGAAIQAVKNFMRRNNEWGTASFDIFDGDRPVGRGSITQ